MNLGTRMSFQAEMLMSFVFRSCVHDVCLGCFSWQAEEVLSRLNLFKPVLNLGALGLSCPRKEPFGTSLGVGPKLRNCDSVHKAF